MYLLDTASKELQLFEGEVPLYAILSHRWGDDEVTFQDLVWRDGGNEQFRKKAGYRKVEKTCELAAAHGFRYAWIDTCCIDKTSSADLSEAINSMYRWYQESGVCYAYLADVPDSSDGMSDETTDPSFSRSAWFTRGWTLQELIAPSTVIFLDQTWQEIGSKIELRSKISRITGIPEGILRKADLASASVAEKMSWAGRRGDEES